MYMLYMYHHLVTTKVCWWLLINDLCLPFVKKLQAAATRSLKRWVGLPRCVNTSILLVGGPRQCGLKVRNLVTVCNLLEASADERCQFLAKSINDRQSNWTRKLAPAREAQIAKTVVLENSESAAPFHHRGSTSLTTVNSQMSEPIHPRHRCCGTTWAIANTASPKEVATVDRAHARRSFLATGHTQLEWCGAPLCPASNHRHCTISHELSTAGRRQHRSSLLSLQEASHLSSRS